MLPPPAELVTPMRLAVNDMTDVAATEKCLPGLGLFDGPPEP
jgi:hypothetical protein